MRREGVNVESGPRMTRPKHRVDIQNAKLPPELAKSRYGKWRALSLSLVYVLMIIHITHWKVSGKTMAPLELSEIMKALELGVISPGVIFIGVMLIGSAIFGRFFCSWGCHMLALQDLFHWILKKLRIRPWPVRSRVLLLVPFLTAGYMFFWPQVKRVFQGRALPEASARLVTTDFWRDLPGPLVIALTVLTCGFLVVYLFGGRGFCTYGCPYGVLFGIMDRFAPGKIRGRAGCEECGKCTAICTSNVRVHEEVKAFGMVVSPRCLKDLDCVSVCPNSALGYGFGLPTLARTRSARPPATRYDFSVLEELAIIVVFAAALFSWRGLYDRLPFLMSIALSAATAYVGVTYVRLFRRSVLDLNRYRLKANGRLTRAGRVFAVTSGLFLLFAAHSGFIQYHKWRGDRFLSIAEDVHGRGEATRGARRAAMERGVAHFRMCDRYGLFSTTMLEFKLGVLTLGLDRVEEAENYLKRAVDRSPTYPEARVNLAKVLARRGETQQAINHLLYALEIYSPHEEYQPRYVHLYSAANADLGRLLSQQAGRIVRLKSRRRMLEQAEQHFVRAIELDTENAQAHFGLGRLAADRGPAGASAAVEHYLAAIKLDPQAAEAHANLGDVYVAQGRLGEAITQYGEALRIDGAIEKAHYKLGFLSLHLGKLPDAVQHLAAAVEQAPDDPEARRSYGEALQHSGRADEAREQFNKAASLLSGG